MNKLKELIRNNIWTALDDYFRHADSDDVYENILGCVHTKESIIMAKRIKPAKTISSLS